MNRKPVSIRSFILIGTLLFTLYSLSFADFICEQKINLKAGWNAIFLIVEPAPPNPDVVFADLPVDQVLSFFPKTSSVQFIKDPTEKEWHKTGWHRWMPKRFKESKFNDLYSLQANRCYLIFCTADYTWNLTGIPYATPQIWQPDSFNLVGFHVDPISPPTFAQYFEGSSAHADQIIYALNQNHWNRVEKPEEFLIQQDKAYWVWCDGMSHYQGPMEVLLPGSAGMMSYESAVSELNIKVINRSSFPLSFTLSSAHDNLSVPLSLVSYSTTLQKITTPFSIYTPDVAIESGEYATVSLAIRRNDFNTEEVSDLLKLSDDMGNLMYIKVNAQQLINDQSR